MNPPGDEVRAKIQRLLVTGDNRLKQGVAPHKARESYEQALDVAREAAALPVPNLTARAAAEKHDVRLQATRVEEILERAVRGRQA